MNEYTDGQIKIWIIKVGTKKMEAGWMEEARKIKGLNIRMDGMNE